MIFTYVCHTGEPLPLTTRGALKLLAEGRAHIERDGVALPAASVADTLIGGGWGGTPPPTLESLAKVGAA